MKITEKNILIVSECMTEHEYRYSDPVSDGANKLVRAICETGFEGDKPQFHYHAFLSSKGFEKHTVEPKVFKDLMQEENATKNLLKKIDKVKADAIVIMGAKLTKTLTHSQTLAPVINKLVETKEDVILNRYVIPTHSPAKVMMEQDSLLNQFANTFYLAIQAASGEEIKTEAAKTPYEMLTTFEDIERAIGYVHEAGVFCFDFETNAEPWYKGWTACATQIAFSIQPGYAYVIPLEHEDSPFTEEDCFKIFRMLKQVFSSKQVIKIAQNLWFDIMWLFKYGIDRKDCKGVWHDTMFLSHQLDSLTPNGLKYMTSIYFPLYSGYNMDIKELFKQGYNWSSIPLDSLASYGAIDTDMTLRIWMYLEGKLLDDDKRHQLYIRYRNYVMPGFWTLAKMSYKGMLMDKKEIASSIEKIWPMINKLEQKMLNYPVMKRFKLFRKKQIIQEYLDLCDEKIQEHKINEQLTGKSKQRFVNDWLNRKAVARAGALPDKWLQKAEIKFTSVPQQKQFLYMEEFLGLEPKPDKFGGGYELTTARAWLNQFTDIPFVQDLLIWKSMKKIANTNYKNFIELCDDNGYIHGNYNICGTRSGRGSSKKPNLQNTTKHHWYDNKELIWAVDQVRKFFINIDDEHEILEADFSQMELRLIANFSGDKTLQQAYIDGIDIHSITSAEIENMTLEEFMAKKSDPSYDFKFKRTTGKMANFSIFYGISVNGYYEYIFKMSGMKYTDRQCQSHINAIKSAYPGITKWWEHYNALAFKNEFVRTLFGMKRRFPNLNVSNDGAYVAACKRQSINSPVQGTSGELCLFLFALMDRVLPEEMIRLMNTVHDSVFGYCKKQYRSWICSVIEELGANYDYVKEFFIIDESLIAIPMALDYSFSDKSWFDIKEVHREEILKEIVSYLE